MSFASHSIEVLWLALALLGQAESGANPDTPKAIPSPPKAEGAAKDIRPLAPGSTVHGGEPAPQPPAAVPRERPLPLGSDRARTTLRPLASELPPPTFREPTEREVAAAALGRIGRPAVPSLVQALGHRDSEVRMQAALVLARIGPDAFDAVPELTALLDDESEGVRKAAARALGQIGPAAGSAVPALMRTLVQPSPVPPGAAVPGVR
jgi:hypothetical protein